MIKRLIKVILFLPACSTLLYYLIKIIIKWVATGESPENKYIENTPLQLLMDW